MHHHQASIPSLYGLLAFDAVVRLGSVTDAARELDATQPAISQRLRTLEEVVGIPLFVRSGRRLQPTRAGRRYHDAISDAVIDLMRATRRLQSDARAQGRELTIAAHFGVARLWLLPRMPRLESGFPGTRFEVLPVDVDDSAQMRDADITIRFGDLDARGSNESPLFGERVYPVCSPGFADAQGLKGTITSEQLARVPLLHMDYEDPRWMDWRRWCQLAGLTWPERMPRFPHNNYPLVLNAAIEGQGLALGWQGLVDPLVEEGTLLALAPAVERRSSGYVLGARQPLAAAIAPVMKWILREGAATRA
ncbi:MAG TPA: LysR substrate-binding domain-containing protein [Gammaproteobacteria bacterium]|nr:LysR substrate-binding domain-containing protein [Gammaproteobacteria bacterium]